jgi:hypothetical protein
MRIISFIEDRKVIKAILKHLGLWLVKSRPPPKAHVPSAGYLRDPFSQLPICDHPLYPAKRGTTSGILTFSRKKRWRIWGGRNRCAPMSLKTACRSSSTGQKRPSRHLPPKFLPSPRKSALNRPKILWQNSLDTQFLFLYIQTAPKRVLINLNVFFAYQSLLSFPQNKRKWRDCRKTQVITI